MCLGVDASNIRSGGGVTHMVELLRAADPLEYGFSKIIVWSSPATLNRTEDRPWLMKSSQPLLEKSFLYRSFWQRFRLSKLARMADCDILFVPGGSYTGDFRPMVTMSQNMLPFEWRELRRYGWSLVTLRLIFLYWIQSKTFCQADGLIFLTKYAHDSVMRHLKANIDKTRIIPHGINSSFANPPRAQLSISSYSFNRPFRILYVSIVDVYKHQWHVAEAVSQLRKSGFPVVLELVGPAYPPALKKLRQTTDKIDPTGEFVYYSGAITYIELPERYTKADLCLFASSCENMPNILLEGMLSGVPIACSNFGPMPEVLGDAGVYFDPESPNDIALALRRLINSPELRDKLSKASFERARVYSWQRCAQETFSFLSEVAFAHRNVL